MVNGRKTQGMETIPVFDFDPTIMAKIMQDESKAKKESQSETETVDAEHRAKIKKKIDLMAYVEYHQKKK